MSRVAIIGGGLAGTACAYVLAQHGLESVLFEKGDVLAPGASGNPRGIYNPRLSAEWSDEAQFYAAAYNLAVTTFRTMPDIDYAAHGSLHLVTTADKRRRFGKMLKNWDWPQTHMHYVDAAGASCLAGVELQHEAVFLPDSGAVSPSRLCEVYTRQSGCEIRLSTEVPEMEQTGSGWRIQGEGFAALILACGADVQKFPPASGLPVHTVRGQIVETRPSETSRLLKCNLCFGGYISPVARGQHILGSSFQKWLTHTEILPEDNRDILARLHETVPALQDMSETTGARAALRTSAQDRLPIIGPLEQGLYVSTAHGSHGLVTSLMGALMIAGDLKGLSRFPFGSVVAPDRFEKRKLRKQGK